ncbi:MAG: hypothetical protein WBC92_18720 [Terracidiphilus sp.]
MKRALYFVSGILVLGAIAYCIYFYRAELGITGPGKAPQNESTDQTSLGPQPAHIEWQPLDRSPDGFRVQMPTGADESQIPAYNELGGVEQVNMISATPGSDTTFAVAWADHPPVERASSEDAEKTLDWARDGALTRTQSVLTGESRTRIDGYPVCQFSARNDQGGILNARLVLAGAHLYMLMATFPAASARRDEDVNRFFDSFVLTPASSGD